MGLGSIVRAGRTLAEAIATLTAAGFPCEVLMVDGQLRHPSQPAPATWGEVRLRTRVGMVTVRRSGEDLTLTVFGNADADLLHARERIAAALAGS